MKSLIQDSQNFSLSITQPVVAQLKENDFTESIISMADYQLSRSVPNMTGFSTTNLWYMVQFFNEYQGDANLQPLVGEISWTKYLIGVATYNTSDSLPVSYKSLLLSDEDINEKLMYFFNNSKLEN